MSRSTTARTFLTLLGGVAILAVAACGTTNPSASATDARATSSSHAAHARADSLVGRYAHYDVVAYGSASMKTLIVSFGFTDLARRGNALVATESFCHADYRSGSPITVTISDAATSAIKPVSIAVVNYTKDGKIHLYRAETPTGIGIHFANPAHDVLPTNPNDPRIADDDHDGLPGITVHIKVSDAIQGDLYIARRERFAYNVTQQLDRSLTGTVTDHSEQLIVGATNDIFKTKDHWIQLADLTKSPIILKPVSQSWGCTQLMAERNSLFPPTPNVDW